MKQRLQGSVSRIHPYLDLVLHTCRRKCLFAGQTPSASAVLNVPRAFICVSGVLLVSETELPCSESFCRKRGSARVSAKSDAVYIGYRYIVVGMPNPMSDKKGVPRGASEKG